MLLDEIVRRKYLLLSWIGISALNSLLMDTCPEITCIIIAWNVFVTSQVDPVPLVTISFLDFCHDSLNSVNSTKFIQEKHQKATSTSS